MGVLESKRPSSKIVVEFIWRRENVTLKQELKVSRQET